MNLPLHVRVVVALGGTNPREEGHPGWYVDWPDGNPYDHNDDCCWACDVHLVAKYDTDWRAAGYLVDRFGIKLRKVGWVWLAGKSGSTREMKADTATRAVCLAFLDFAEKTL